MIWLENCRVDVKHQSFTFPHNTSLKHLHFLPMNFNTFFHINTNLSIFIDTNIRCYLHLLINTYTSLMCRRLKRFLQSEAHFHENKIISACLILHQAYKVSFRKIFDKSRQAKCLIADLYFLLDFRNIKGRNPIGISVMQYTVISHH